MHNSIAVNSRILSNHLTGVQRYLNSILMHWPEHEYGLVSPSKALDGVKGHAWEQFGLPRKLNGRVLWSPSNSGPIAVSNQVLTMHDIASIELPEFLNWKFSAWYRFLLPKLTKRVDKIIAISHFTKDRLINHLGVDERKIEVIWNGVDDRFSVRPEEESLLARQKLGLPHGRYFLALGSLEPRKNLKRLLEAWSNVVQELPEDVNLILAGAKGKALVFGGLDFGNIPERVFLTGHVPDQLLPGLYSGALGAPYLSVYEGFGLPPLEAMACGAPVLTGNLTALPEVVGSAGIMVDPYNVDEISDALKKLATDEFLRSKLISAGLAQAKKFDWKATADATLSAMKSL